SVRPINRILQRRGALDGRRRVRRPPPPRGGYVPDLAKGRAERDPFDSVEGLGIKAGRPGEVLNGVSRHGGRPGSWPVAAPGAAKMVGAAWLEPWREVGVPRYA